MKNKKSFWGLMALVLMFGVIVMGCDDGKGGGDDGHVDLPVETIKWKTDGNGFTQFYTNDTANCGYGFFSSTNHSGNTYEAEVKKVSGSAGQGYGMTFLYDSPNNNHLILISTNGGYCIWKTVGENDTEIKPWTASPVITQGYNQVNKLKVVKSGNNFTVYINDTEVTTFISSDDTGTKIGTYVGVGTSVYESFPNTPVDVRFKLLQ